MLAPCGHKNAVCVVGNYWQCPTCDGLAPLQKKIEAGQAAMATPRTWQRNGYGVIELTQPDLEAARNDIGRGVRYSELANPGRPA